jgi:hypothetical protein
LGRGCNKGTNGPLGIATIVVGRNDTCCANDILTILDRDGESREKDEKFFLVLFDMEVVQTLLTMETMMVRGKKKVKKQRGQPLPTLAPIDSN